jgi:ATP-dependent protease ClpP protease subunit
MNFVNIENRRGKISLNETVNPASINRLIEELGELYGNAAVENQMRLGEIVCSASDALESVTIEIHSPGGSVLDGYRLYNSIKEMQSRGVHVTAYINTLAASMASVIAMAADEIQIVKGGRMMIHEASTVTAGDAADHSRTAKNLDEISQEIAEIYAARTGSPVAIMRQLMRNETWMGADEAVELKFADRVIDPAAVETETKSESNLTTMGLFNKSSDAQAAIIALEAENAEIREQFIALQATAAESAERVVTLRAELSEIEAERDTALTTIEEKERVANELAAQLAEAKAKLETFDAEVDGAAIAKAAALGFQGDLPSGSSESSEKAATKFEQYRELQKTDPVAAGKFWVENEADILSLKI